MIKELQNIGNPSDALEADLKNKPHLVELWLEWALIAISSVDQTKAEDVIENLQPSKHLKKLSIRNYVGNQFPNWLLENSLPNLVSLVLFNCKCCQRFPPLGDLPFLKNLQISVLDEIVRIDADFHGSNIPSFKSLETLVFYDMMEWEKWDCQAVTGAFPRLQDLFILSCPKLKGHLPQQLVPLKTLIISQCQQLEASTPRALYLELRECGKLQLDWGTMKKLTMSRHNMEASLLEIVGSYSSLEHLDILSPAEPISDDSVSLRTFPLDFFPALRELVLSGFPNLQMVSQDHAHNHLEDLTIKECPKFESFPENMHTLLPSLKDLRIEDCPSLESFPDAGLPSNLKNLVLRGCPMLNDSLEGAFEDNALLESLSIRELYAESFPVKDLLPLSLTSLTIIGCPNLTKLDYEGLHQLSSLKSLILWNCPNLQRLPEEGLPRSISYLSIRACPLLQQRCQKPEGEDWEKVAHIHQVFLC